MATAVLIDRITHTIENGEYVLGVFLDFSNTFDTVDQNILMHSTNRTRNLGPAQLTQNICITFIQCWYNVKEVGPTLLLSHGGSPQY